MLCLIGMKTRLWWIEVQRVQWILLLFNNIAVAQLMKHLTRKLLVWEKFKVCYVFWNLKDLYTVHATLKTSGLVYQFNVEMSADLSAQINLRQGSGVIHETFIWRQSHCTDDCTFINVVADNHRYLNIMPLKTLWFRSLAKRNLAQKDEVISWKRSWYYSKNTC